MSSDVEIRVPAEQTEGTRSQILRWLKSVGDSVTENEPLIEIETDKVTVEVAAPGSGTLREIHKQEQEEVAPGELLGRIEALRSPAATGERDLGVATNARAANASALSASNAASEAARFGAPHDASASAAAETFAPPPPNSDRSAAHALSPAVRRLLAEHGLEASAVAGTGQGGRITVEDVLTHARGGARHSPNPRAAPTGQLALTGQIAPTAQAAPTAQEPPTAPGAAPRAARPEPVVPSRSVPHTAVRKRIAEHMVQSLLHTAPHVTTVFEANLAAVLQHRERNKEDFARRGAPLTLTAYFLQATVAAIRAVPEANSRWTDSALQIYDAMHIGIATALDGGLVVPVLRDTQSRDLFETARGLEDIVSRAREGRLTPADVRGGTFTISNHGVSGSLVATPIIINQPQSAILGVGKLEKRPVVVSTDGEDTVVIQPRCYVTLTIDHRVMDGHQANRFLQTFVEWLATVRR